MTVAQDQPVIRAIQQKALRETLDHRLAGAGFVQDDPGPQHRTIRLALGPGDRMSVFLAAVAGDDGRFDVPGGEGFRGRDQAFSEPCLVLVAVAPEQRLGIRKNFRGRNAENVPRALADIGVADLLIGRDHALVHHHARQAGK